MNACLKMNDEQESLRHHPIFVACSNKSFNRALMHFNFNFNVEQVSIGHLTKNILSVNERPCISFPKVTRAHGLSHKSMALLPALAKMFFYLNV